MNRRDFLHQTTPIGREGRYSQNLHKWVKHQCADDLLAYFSPWSVIDGSMKGRRNPSETQMSMLYLTDSGTDEDGWLMGARLSEIVCGGSKASRFAYQPKMAFQPVGGWTEQYINLGKCWLDPGHLFYYERWEESGNCRRCKWCGTEQVKITKMVPEQRWVTPEVLGARELRE